MRSGQPSYDLAAAGDDQKVYVMKVNLYFSPACPWDSIDNALYAVSAACCTELTPCNSINQSVPSECTFDCNRVFAPFIKGPIMQLEPHLLQLHVINTRNPYAQPWDGTPIEMAQCPCTALNQ